MLKYSKIKQYINDCIEICKKAGYDYPYDKINFDISNTFRTLGDYDFYYNTLRLNKNIFNEDEDLIKNTILHELAHYINHQIAKEKDYIIYRNGQWLYNDEAIRRSPYYKRDLLSHGSLWQKVADKLSQYINSQITRTGHSLELEKHRENNMRYTITCKNCGNTFQYARKTDFVESPNQKSSFGNWYKYKCGKCNQSGQFKVKDNKTGQEWE